MAINATVNSGNKNRIALKQNPTREVRTTSVAPSEANYLRALQDVDLSNLQDGSIISYDQTSGKFVASNKVDGGSF